MIFYTEDQINIINSGSFAKDGEYYYQDNGLIWIGTYNKKLKLISAPSTLPIGASTEATLVQVNTSVNSVIDELKLKANLTETQPVDTGLVQGLTDTQLRAIPVPISGTVTATVDTTGLATEATLTEVSATASNIDSNTGNKTDTSATTDIGTFSLISLFKRLLEKFTVLNNKDFSTSVNQVVQTTAINNILDDNNGTFDAFYRQRMSNPETVFDSKQLNDKQPLFWDDQLISGSGGASTYNTNQASTTLSVALNTTCRRIRQTFRRFNYQPGKSQLFIQTGIIGASLTGIKTKIGLFDDKNGLFFSQQSTGIGVTIRTFTSGTAVDTNYLQSSWNLDKMDGTGASGITLNFTKCQIFFGDFEWLGVGRVRFGVFVNGRPYYVHEVNNANNSTLVYMSVPNLPLRYEIENTGTGIASSITHICSTVISEGGHESTGGVRGINRSTVPLVTLNNTSIYPIISIRLNSNYLTTKIDNIQFSFVCTSTSAFAWYLILNPTVVGVALNFTNITNSGIDSDVISTNLTTITGGTIIRTGVSQQQNEASAIISATGDLQLGANISGVGDVLVLAVQRLTGTTETFYSAMNWEETN